MLMFRSIQRAKSPKLVMYCPQLSTKVAIEATTATGTLFHARESATGNTRSPQVGRWVDDGRNRSVVVLEECWKVAETLPFAILRMYSVRLVHTTYQVYYCLQCS